MGIIGFTVSVKRMWTRNYYKGLNGFIFKKKGIKIKSEFRNEAISELHLWYGYSFTLTLFHSFFLYTKVLLQNNISADFVIHYYVN